MPYREHMGPEREDREDGAELPDRVQQGIAEGWITPSRGEGLQPPVRYRSSVTIAEMLDEDRG